MQAFRTWFLYAWLPIFVFVTTAIGIPPVAAQEADGADAGAAEAPATAGEGAESGPTEAGTDFPDLEGLAGGEDFAFDTPEAIRDYALSVGDSFTVNVWAPDLRITQRFTVPFEGKIFLPQVGEIGVNGLTTREIKSRLETILRRRHPGINVSVLLTRTRKIRVFVTGLVPRPGVIQVPALSRLSAALGRAGGVLREGSLRQITIKRPALKDPLIIDYYRFRLKGDTAGNPLLKAGDLIHIRPIAHRAEIRGAVFRPGTFEFLPGETIGDLIEMAHGLTPGAALIEATLVNTKSLKREEREEKRLDLSAPGALDRKLTDLDRVYVPAHTIAVISRPRTRVAVGGAVEKPGVLTLTLGTRLRDALTRVGAIKPGAGLREVKIYHKVPSGEARFAEPKIVDAYKLLYERDESQNVELEDGDMVLVPDSKNLAEDAVVYVFGQVGSPGKIPYRAGDRLSDYLNKAGGVPEKANLHRVSITRSRTNSSFVVDAYRIRREGKFDEDPVLEPGDIVFVPEEFFHVANFRDVVNLVLASATVVAAIVNISSLVKPAK